MDVFPHYIKYAFNATFEMYSVYLRVVGGVGAGVVGLGVGGGGSTNVQ